jgi:hypothetical protein
MNIVFVRQARSEFVEALQHYSERQPGLEGRLNTEIKKHLDWIAQNHEAPRIRDGGYRRVNLKIFPYYIAYIVRESTIWVLAIAHQHRQPEYWIQRKKTPPIE